MFPVRRIIKNEAISVDTIQGRVKSPPQKKLSLLRKYSVAIYLTEIHPSLSSSVQKVY